MADPSLSRDRVYQEIRASIRATDEISFKLLGLVPLTSGVGFLTLFFEDKVHAKPVLVVALSLFAALITLGLYRWELRNIQTCSWLLRCAQAMAMEATHAEPTRPDPPQSVGKAEAEKAVYTVTIIAWLLMPTIACPLDKAPNWLVTSYVVLGLLTAGLTVVSAWAEVRVPTSSVAPATQPLPAAAGAGNSQKNPEGGC